MGKLGAFLGHNLGGIIGHYAGKRFGKYTGIDHLRGAGIGSDIGGQLGELLPFKKGGKIKKNGKIYAHKGEFILPKGVKPTTHQVKIVRRRHKQ
jgi:hypothetical protein